jgi:hypothetical protein
MSINTFKKQLGTRWIRSKTSGNTYLCPASALEGMSDPTDEQLEAACVNESLNPQNN